MRIKTILLIAVVLLSIEMKGQIGRLALSPLQKIEQNIGVTEIKVVYSRPSMRGRVIFGQLVPYDELWRTGANRNTTVEFSEDVSINNKRIKKGKYALFSIPSEKQWEIILYKDTDNWNVPEVLDNDKIAVKVMVESKHLSEKIEVFTIAIGDFTNYALDLNISWSQTSVTVPIELTTKELMDDKIDDVLNGPDYNDYYAAAVYQMESGKEFEKGLEWINKAMAVKDEITFWDLRVKAILQMELGAFDEARKNAIAGLKMAEEANREYGINEFKKILSKVGN